MEDFYELYRDLHDNRNYKLHEIDDIPVEDFNNIFANAKGKKKKVAKQGEKSAQEVLNMF